MKTYVIYCAVFYSIIEKSGNKSVEMKRIGPKYLNACSLNGTMHAEKQAETGCTLGFALDYYFSQVTNFIVYILK
jgi:hypothetical protein